MQTNRFFSTARRWALRLALLALLLALGALAAAPAHAAPKATRLVSPTGTDSGDCTGSPCKTITYALTQAAADDTISVAAGTYSAANGETLPLVPGVNVTINGAGASSTTIDGGSASRVMTVNSGRNVTVQNVTIANGKCNSCSGGGIYNYGTLTASNSTFSKNMAGGSFSDGGGIFNEGTLSVSNSTFSDNLAGDDGSGIFNKGTQLTVSNSTFSGNSASDLGGGIYNDTGKTLTVSNSTFSGNSAGYDGGGINNYGTLTVSNSTFSGNSAGYDGGGICNNGTLTVSNSTFSGNSATYYGGGINNNYGKTLTVRNSTFSSNSAASNSGGGIRNYGTLNYANTIIANSTSGGDCRNNGTIGTNTNNLVQDGSCSASLSGDPMLGALADNGGATQTIALQPNSPAIDAGNATTCSNSPISGLDQRGQARNDLQCDIGAYEMQMSDCNNTTLNPETTMRTFGPPRVGIQYSGTNPGSTTATKVTNWTGGTPANALGAWWDLTPTTNTGLDLTLKLCYSTEELGSLTEGNLRFWRYSGGTWSQVGDVPTFSGTSPNRCAEISGVTALSRWTLATGNPGGAPTAVTLSSFRATAPMFDLAAWFADVLRRWGR